MVDRRRCSGQHRRDDDRDLQHLHPGGVPPHAMAHALAHHHHLTSRGCCAWQGTAGEITFLGGGTFVAIGSPNIEWANIISENGAVRPTTRRRCWWWWCEQSLFLGVGCGDGDVGALSPDAIRRHGTEAFPG